MAGNIIDSFVLSLGFDTSALTTGRRQVLEEFKQVKNEAASVGKSMEAEGKRAAEFFAQVKTEAMALIGVLTGSAGLGALVKHVSDDLAGLGRAAANLDMDPQLLQAWGLAMRREVGGSIEATTAQFRHLQTELTLWKNFGTSAISDAGKAIHLNPSMSPIQAIMQAAKYVATTKDDNARQMQLLQSIFDDKTIAFIRMGAARMRQAVQDSLPDTSTREQIKRATDLSNAFIALGDALKHIADNIVSDDVAPWLIPLLGRMREFTHDHPQFVATVEKIGGALSLWLGMRAAAGLIATATGMTTLASAMDGLAAAALRLFGPLAALGFIGAAGGQATQSETDATTRRLQEQGNIPPSGAPHATTGWRGWLNRNLPSWMTGAGLTPADPAAVARSLGQTPGGGGDGSIVPSGPGPRADMSLPRGVRNNNPLNLEYRPGQGAANTDGRFGIYATMEEGVAAASRQLLRYQTERGLNTVRGIINRWAPPGENDSRKYAETVAAAIGVSPDQQIDLNDPSVMAKMISAMARVENGRGIDTNAVNRGVAISKGGPRVAASGTLPPPTLEPKKAPNPLDNIDPNAPNLFPPRDSPFKSMPMPTNTPVSSSGNTDQSSTFTVGEIHVHTQATDASGIGRDIHQALANELMSKSDRGLS